METKNLRNTGNFSINYGGGVFKPNSTIAFPLGIAKKLRRLYPDTVQDLEAAVEVYKEKVEVAVVKEEKPKGKKSKGA